MSTSLVAVCCSRASRSSSLRVASSVKSRTFSMAMTAWSAKVWSSATCRSLKSRASVRRTLIEPMATPSLINGAFNVVRWPKVRAVALPSGNSSTSVCRSATWITRASSTDRPLAVPWMSGSQNSPTGPKAIGP